MPDIIGIHKKFLKTNTDKQINQLTGYWNSLSFFITHAQGPLSLLLVKTGDIVSADETEGKRLN